MMTAFTMFIRQTTM